jgi:hypothetical protein
MCILYEEQKSVFYIMENNCIFKQNSPAGKNSLWSQIGNQFSNLQMNFTKMEELFSSDAPQVKSERRAERNDLKKGAAPAVV